MRSPCLKWFSARIVWKWEWLLNACDRLARLIQGRVKTCRQVLFPENEGIWGKVRRFRPELEQLELRTLMTAVQFSSTAYSVNENAGTATFRRRQPGDGHH